MRRSHASQSPQGIHINSIHASSSCAPISAGDWSSFAALPSPSPEGAACNAEQGKTCCCCCNAAWRNAAWGFACHIMQFMTPAAYWCFWGNKKTRLYTFGRKAGLFSQLSNFQHFAERMGFEPMKPFWSLHTFQACAIDHSAISPLRLRASTGEACFATCSQAQAKVVFFYQTRKFLSVCAPMLTRRAAAGSAAAPPGSSSRRTQAARLFRFRAGCCLRNASG